MVFLTSFSSSSFCGFGSSSSSSEYSFFFLCGDAVLDPDPDPDPESFFFRRFDSGLSAEASLDLTVDFLLPEAAGPEAEGASRGSELPREGGVWNLQREKNQTLFQ